MTSVARLSIGLPVFNGENYLAESIDALLGQSYEDFELIIGDNASTDSTPEICSRYAKLDPRVRYFRQPRNVGISANRSSIINKANGEFYKEAAHDDLYAQNLLRTCVEALDEYPDVVLAHSWTAAIDEAGNVIQALPYPLITDSTHAPERFRSILFGSADDNGLISADDEYGVIRMSVLRQVAPLGSYYHADRALMAEVALYGRFQQTPDWLYFRRDHANRAQRAKPTVRAWCANLDPRRANRLWHPTVRLLAEYPMSYFLAIRRAPLSRADRQECYGHLVRWFTERARMRISPRTDLSTAFPKPSISKEDVYAAVAGKR